VAQPTRTTATDLAAEMGEELASMTQLGRPAWRGIGRGLAVGGVALALVSAGADATSVAAQVPHAPRGPIVAAAARTMSINDNGELLRVHASGEIITEEGKVSGTLPGTAKVRLDIGAELVTASFRITVRGVGSIVGHASAKLSSPGRKASFRGTLSVTGGTGRYAHARGTGKLYGVVERVSDNLTVQTREGTLDY
jgi:hypothetical protein